MARVVLYAHESDDGRSNVYRSWTRVTEIRVFMLGLVTSSMLDWERSVALVFGKLRITRSRTLGWVGGASRPVYIPGHGPTVANWQLALIKLNSLPEFSVVAATRRGFGVASARCSGSICIWPFNSRAIIQRIRSLNLRGWGLITMHSECIVIHWCKFHLYQIADICIS